MQLGHDYIFIQTKTMILTIGFNIHFLILNQQIRGIKHIRIQHPSSH